MLDWTRGTLISLCTYECFERTALRVMQVLLGLMTAYAIVLVLIKVGGDIRLGEAFLDKAALQDTFGSILTILILLEFNHSVHVAVTQKTGAIQVKIVVLITILVIARKLMLLDYAATSVQTLLGFAALLLALGGLYWLISSGDTWWRRGEIQPKPRLAGDLPAQ